MNPFVCEMPTIELNLRHFVLAVFIAGILGFPVPLFAQGMDVSDPGSTGEEEPVPVAPQPLFDDSETFVPPELLPIEDTYIGAAEAMSDQEIAENLETISITPSGEIETIPTGDSEIDAFRAEIRGLMEAMEGDEEEGARPSEAEGAGANELPVEGVSLESGVARPESVIGADTRTRVTATTSYPFRTVGRIDIGCTGTLIGPRHVLTAGHCVYNIRSDKWYSKLSFSPGQKGSHRPYGKIGWKRALSVKGWTKNHKRNYDYGMIVLKQNIGKRIGWMGYGWKKPMPKYNVNINGYPGDKPFGTMWHAFCKLRIITTYRLYYPCDTYGGMSGSGVYLYNKAKKTRIIYGIHAYGVDSTGLNGATRIRKAVFTNLKKWKAQY